MENGVPTRAPIRGGAGPPRVAGMNAPLDVMTATAVARPAVPGGAAGAGRPPGTARVSVVT
ncbi:hypothetical protein GCM10009678_24360 [Actinomadura kijaniata]